MNALNPHDHPVATITDERDGTFSVSVYQSTSKFPANVVCPLRPQVGQARQFSGYGDALDYSEKINEPRT